MIVNEVAKNVEKIIMANPPLDRCHKVENWSNLKLI